MKTLVTVAILIALVHAGATQLEKSFSESDTATNIAARNIGGH